MTQSTLRFDLQTQVTAGLERLDALKEELRAALGSVAVRLSGSGGQWTLEVDPAEDEAPVALLDLLDELPAPGGLSAVLGLAEDDRPVLVDLAAAEAAHVLIVGEPGAGKSALLRTIALSLALTRRQADVQLLLFDGAAAAEDAPSAALRPLEYLPHVLGPVVESAAEAVEVLSFLAQEAVYRIEQRACTPAIIVLIDDLALLAQADPARTMAPLATLLTQGAAAGIHLVVTVEDAADPLLDSLLLAHLPVRLVGCVPDAAAARTAAGVGDTQAEYLYGAGDFLAVAGGSVTHFQAGYVGSYDLHFALESLQRLPGQPLLAQRFDPRIRGRSSDVSGVRAFSAGATPGELEFESIVSARKTTGAAESVSLPTDRPDRTGRKTIVVDAAIRSGGEPLPRARGNPAPEAAGLRRTVLLETATPVAPGPLSASETPAAAPASSFVGRRPTLYASDAVPGAAPRVRPVAQRPPSSVTPLPGERPVEPPARKAPAEPDMMVAAPPELEYVDLDEEVFAEADEEPLESAAVVPPVQNRARGLRNALDGLTAAEPGRDPGARARLATPAQIEEDDVIPFE